MKRFRKLMVKILLSAFILTGITVPTWATGASENTISFPDVPQTAWYLEDLQYILKDSRRIFAGYPDGTFKPNDTLTADMYIKLIVTVMGHKVENGKDYWASTYIQKAIEEGYVDPMADSWFMRKYPNDQYYGYKQPIRRVDMAQVTGRALDKLTDDSEYRDPFAVCELIKDYKEIYVGCKSNVVKCYDLGILTGFPDGEFKPNNELTRAEAVAVIRRLIDKSARKRSELPTFPNPSPTPIPVAELNRPERKDLGNGVVEVEGISFNPETDTINESSKFMRILKAEEFVGVALKHLKFYEHEGKARVKGYIPELPEGYEWMFALHCNVKETDDRGFHGGIYTTEKNESIEFRLPKNGKTFDMPLYTNKENIISLVLVCEINYERKANSGTLWISFTEKRYSRYDAVGGHSLVQEFDPRGFIEW
ncbi:MAG: S-layer homology domain-containing protein [Clostridia bacterium]|nr:S-layer homology domain-containing protein [Clostridia bacterium]